MTSQNFSSLNVSNECTACAYVKYIEMWNDKNEDKWGRFSEESPTCVKILQDNLNKANAYHKRRRLTTNTAELGCLAWDVMRNFFYSDLTVK